jgi:hypothetical protein
MAARKTPPSMGVKMPRRRIPKGGALTPIKNPPVPPSVVAPKKKKKR